MKGKDWKGMNVVKFLKNFFLVIITCAIFAGGLYVTWQYLLPETIVSKIEESLGILEDSGIKGEEYTEFDTLYYPYYGFLSEDGKKLYGQVYANALKMKTTFLPVMELSVEEVDNVVKAVFYDHPELFWMDSGFGYKYVDDNTCVQITLQFNETVKDIKTARKNFEQKSSEIINGASMFSTDYEKEKYVYDSIIDVTEYDIDASVNQSPYSALVNGKSVCAGYARAFQYIMTKLSIPTYYCAGMSKGHAWNIVKLENGYYNVDLTWDEENNTAYEYFNRTDDSLGRGHNRSGYSVLLPKCKATKYTMSDDE